MTEGKAGCGVHDASPGAFAGQGQWLVAKPKFYSKSRNTPFDGWQLAGKVFGVYHKGQWWASPEF